MVALEIRGKFTADETPIEIESHYLPFGKLQISEVSHNRTEDVFRIFLASGLENSAATDDTDDRLFHAVRNIEVLLDDKVCFSRGRLLRTAADIS